METLQRTANRGSVSTGYDVANSCKFEKDNSERLQRSYSNIGTPTNADKFTFSIWIKRTELQSSGEDIFFCGNAGGVTTLFAFQNDVLKFRTNSGDTEIKTNRVLRDTAAWYHIVVAYDSTDSTEANRVKFYVNGVQETSLGTANYPTQNADSEMYETNMSHFVGGPDGSQTAPGYYTELYFLDGQVKQASDFGEFDSDSGIWKPIEYTGSFGNEGYYLDFEDSSNLGLDVSGNSNSFNALYGISAADQATDTPTNNFCTWSPLWAEPRANGTISEGATQVAWGGGAWKIARSSMAVSKGRWYWEIKGANVTGDTWNNNLFGFASVDGEDGQYGPSVLIGYSTGNYYYRVADSQTGDSSTGWDSGGAWSSSDTFGFALDLESSTKKFILYRNGSAVNGSGTDLVSAFQTEQFFTPYSSSYNGDTQFLNWGGYTVNTISSAASDANGYGTFEYAPPSGYYAICTKNLAEFG